MYMCIERDVIIYIYIYAYIMTYSPHDVRLVAAQPHRDVAVHGRGVAGEDAQSPLLRYYYYYYHYYYSCTYYYHYE